MVVLSRLEEVAVLSRVGNAVRSKRVTWRQYGKLRRPLVLLYRGL